MIQHPVTGVIIELDDMFEAIAMAVSTGVLVVVHKRDGEVYTAPLDVLRCRSMPCENDVSSGASASSFKFTAFASQHPRAGNSHLFGKLTDLYQFMKLKSVQNTPIKWVYACMERWTVVMEKAFGCEEHFCWGIINGSQTSRRMHQPWHLR